MRRTRRQRWCAALRMLAASSLVPLAQAAGPCAAAANATACDQLPQCEWAGGCAARYPVVGSGDCADAAGAVLPHFVSVSDGFSTTAGQCRAFCDALPQCAAYRVRSVAGSTGHCVLYTDPALAPGPAAPGAGFVAEPGGGGTAPVTGGTGLAVGELPPNATFWSCRARPCEAAADCGCVAGACGEVKGVKGACSCTATPTASLTPTPRTRTLPLTPTRTRTAPATLTATLTVPPTTTGTATATEEGTATITAVPYDECGARRCGEGQACVDPAPTLHSFGDFVCSCLNDSSSRRVGGPVARCSENECETLRPCPSGQTCSDANHSTSSRGDWSCACVNEPSLRAVGRPVASCAVLRLDECDPSPCPAGQLCADPDTRAVSRLDYVCACANGGPSQVGGGAPRCEYDECGGLRCGLHQRCLDRNTTSTSLLDFVCYCISTGDEAVGAAVAFCPPPPPVTATATLPASTAGPSAGPTRGTPVSLVVGAFAAVRPDAAAVREAVTEAGLRWTDPMHAHLGGAGRVLALDSRRNAKLGFSDGSVWWWPPEVLTVVAAPPPAPAPPPPSPPPVPPGPASDGRWEVAVLAAFIGLCLIIMLCYISGFWRKPAKTLVPKDRAARAPPPSPPAAVESPKYSPPALPGSPDEPRPPQAALPPLLGDGAGSPALRSSGAELPALGEGEVLLRLPQRPSERAHSLRNATHSHRRPGADAARSASFQRQVVSAGSTVSFSAPLPVLPLISDRGGGRDGSLLDRLPPLPP
eukprot:TRINITY_DN1790_c0_g2_i1.p1 TRINITY_DN1790_c0_g2~~TRINITY_DN1790_c0_g2_i1.p1  ORF type:complete len:758 (+),score=160.09 TRINITY_DN1790_c0_g2_i1:98-2371(+)